MVSNEDREAAVKALINVSRVSPTLSVLPYTDEEVTRAVRSLDALIAHGWGPRPQVSIDAIATALGFLDAEFQLRLPPRRAQLATYMRECGIEVTQ